MLENYNVGCKILSRRRLRSTKVSALPWSIYKKASTGASADAECSAVLHGLLNRACVDAIAVLHGLLGLTYLPFVQYCTACFK